MTANPDLSNHPDKIDNLGLTKYEAGKKPANSRLKDAGRAQELGHKLIKNNEERSRKNALIKGQIDGNLPMSPARLKAAGQSWRTNVNFGEAKASVSAALTPFYDLFTGSKYHFFVETKFGANTLERHRYSTAITEEADYYVKEWDGFDFNIQAMLFDMVTYGKAFINWPIDQNDWRFQWLSQHLLLVPDNTKAHGSKVPVAVIRQEYLVHELFHLIQKKGAAAAGWNAGYAQKCIAQAYEPNKGTGDPLEYEAIQQKIRDNDLFEGMEAEKIPVFHLLVCELSGKISHLIVPEKGISTDGDEEPIQFIYEGIEEYDNFLNAITPFFFETLDGSWNGANGLGRELYAAIEIKNRLKGSTVDAAFLRNSVVLQAVDSTSLERASLMQIGAFSIIPSGFNIQPATIMGDLEGPMLVDAMLSNDLQTNTGIWRGRRDKPQGNPRTAEEVRIDFNQSATLSNSAVNRFYLNLDRLYTELFRRLKKDKEFVKRCTERGIPKEAVEQTKCVKALRAVGNGSAFMRQQAQRELGPLVPMMPESGRMQWAKDTASSATNSYTAERYFPEPGDDVGKTDHAAMAMLENAAMKIGLPPIWTPSQNNVIHAQTHLQFAASAAESLSQGGNPMDVLNTLDVVGPHAMLHIEKLKGDKIRETEYKALSEELKRLIGIAESLKADIQRHVQESAQKQREAMEAQQAAMTDADIAMVKAQNDMGIKKAKAEQQIQQKSEAHNMKMVQADIKTAATIEQMKAKLEMQKEAAAASASKGDE